MSNIMEFIENESISKQREQYEPPLIKDKRFVLINNKGLNVEAISSFFYDSVNQRICIHLLETYVMEWYVPLSEGNFILVGLQKALNACEDFNFHFSRTKANSTFFQRIFSANERTYKDKNSDPNN